MSATLVTLIDGQIVTSDADAWRDECLARHLLRLPLPERRAWLADFEVKHGAADAEMLKATMTALHEKGRAA